MSAWDGYPDVNPVRSYVITGGRAHPTRNTVRPESIVSAADGKQQLPGGAGTQERALLQMCRRPLSVAEAAVHLQLPVSVVRVLVSDLVDKGVVRVSGGESSRPGLNVLQEVLHALENLA
jgi:hypothetical protein